MKSIPFQSSSLLFSCKRILYSTSINKENKNDKHSDFTFFPILRKQKNILRLTQELTEIKPKTFLYHLLFHPLSTKEHPLSIPTRKKINKKAPFWFRKERKNSSYRKAHSHFKLKFLHLKARTLSSIYKKNRHRRESFLRLHHLHTL